MTSYDLLKSLTTLITVDLVDNEHPPSPNFTKTTLNLHVFLSFSVKTQPKTKEHSFSPENIVFHIFLFIYRYDLTPGWTSRL